MRAYDTITVRGWRKSGVISERHMLVMEDLSVSLDGPANWGKTMRRLSNCLYVLVTTSDGVEKTIRRLEGERWGRGTARSEADHLEHEIFNVYMAYKASEASTDLSSYAEPS